MKEHMVNNNHHGLDEIEEKKWLISRLDLYHKITINLMKETLIEFEADAEKILSRFKSYRNNILSGIGIVLTVLLGTISVYPIEQSIFYLILSVLGFVGMMVIIIFSFLNNKFENSFSLATEIFNSQINMHLYCQGYLTSGGAFLSNITIYYIENYFVFIGLLIHADGISLSQSFTKLAKKYSKYHQIKQMLLKRVTPERNIESIRDLYQRFDYTQKVPPDPFEYIEEVLRDYKPKKPQSS